MKKILLLILITAGNLLALSDATSKTFLMLRPVNGNVAMQRDLWHKMADIQNGSTQSGYQFYVGYQKTTNNQSGLSKYFLLGNKTKLTVKGDTISTTDRDVRAEWLGLPDSFTGTLELKPEQERVGGTLEFKRALSKYFKAGFFKNMWVGISTSLESATKNIGVHDSGGSGTNTIKLKLNDADLEYARFNDKRTKSGLSEVRLNFGTDFKPANSMDLGLYSFLTIPGSVTKNNAVYLFEATRGYNRHIGLGTGMHMQFPLSSGDGSYIINFYLDGEATALFANQQMRTFDLKDKPWSRYMLLNDDNIANPSVPATTVLTQNVKVEPHSLGEVSTGFRLQSGGLEATLGYAMWGHGTEELELVNAFTTNYGIAGDALDESASTSTISERKANDSTFTKIVQDDIDLLSGSGGSAITHRAVASLGYVHLGERLDAMFGFGGFFELPQNNSMVRQWGGWVKLGVFF